MQCDHAVRLLARKASRDLDSLDERALAGHLSECADCAHFQDQLDRTWSALAYHPSVEVSRGFRSGLKEKILADAASPHFKRGWRPAWRWQWAALAVCITVAVVILTRDSRLPSTVSPATTGTSISADRDRRDEEFLQDLEQTLQHSATDFLSVYDSWPDAVQESPSAEPARTVPLKQIRQKEPS